MTTLLAPNALANLATVKAELGIADTSSDDVVSRLINAASDACENYCGRKRFPFYRDTTTETLGVPVTFETRIRLSRKPVEFVSPAPQVYTDLDPGPGQLVDPANYFLEDPVAGFIYSRGRWRTTAVRRPDIVQDFDPGSEEETVQVVYTGGYVTQLQVDGYNAAAWSSKTWTLRDLVKPAGHTSQVWQATTGGAAGVSEPTWPASPTIGQTLTDGAAVWTYTGWVPATPRTLPSDIEQACIDAAVTLYRRRGQDLDIRSESLLGASLSYATRGTLPPSAMATLSAYRSWEVL